MSSMHQPDAVAAREPSGLDVEELTREANEKRTRVLSVTVVAGRRSSARTAGVCTPT